MFSRFDVLGSARQTYRWFHEERIELPVNKAIGGRFQLVWQLPTLGFIKDVLGNPLYTGAYVYGRRPTEVVVKDGQAMKRQPRTMQRSRYAAARGYSLVCCGVAAAAASCTAAIGQAGYGGARPVQW